MFRRKGRAALAAGIAVAGLSGLAAVPSGAATSHGFTGNPVVIGLPYCQTGYLSAADPYILSGLQMGAAALNASGGILHHQVKVVGQDTQCIATNEVTVANQMILQDHAAAIVGAYQSTALPALLPVTQQAGVAFLASGILPSTGNWGITLFPPTANEANSAVNYVHSKLHIKSIGNISGVTAGGLAIQANVQQLAQQLHMTSAEQEISTTATDATPVLQSVDSNGAILTNTSGPINLIMAENASSLGLKIPLVFINDGLTDCLPASQKYAHVLCLLPADTLASHISNRGIRTQDDYLLQQMRKQRIAADQLNGVAVGWDEAHMIALAMTEAKSVSGAKAQAKLASISFTGAQGIYHYTPGRTFGLKGNPYDVVSISNGRVKVLAIPSAGY